MKYSWRIALDVMGNEHAPSLFIEAANNAMHYLPKSIELVLLVTAEFAAYPLLHPNITFHTAPEYILPVDTPIWSLHNKTSTLSMGLELLKENKVDALISAGNTGALLAGAILLLPMLPAIERPALLVTLPTRKEPIAILDVGANAACHAHHLMQFALLGAAFQRCSKKKDHNYLPTVGLLNMGSEAHKGPHVVCKAFHLLQEEKLSKNFRFIGNIEGNQIFEGHVDVLVTDGFVGNTLLKTAEGTADFFFQEAKKLAELLPHDIANSILRDLQYKGDYSQYRGALFCGIDRVLIKCHGRSNQKAIINSILGAIELLQNDFIAQLKQELQFSQIAHPPAR